jgi:hypothetical protein
VNWLLPGFLGAACAVGIPLLLHLLRRKPKTLVRFPTLRFLQEGSIRDMRKHRLLRLITLALRCLIIALLAAAFARPFFANTHAGAGQLMIVAVDNSMSMQTKGRWEQRRKWALDQLDGLQPGDQAGVLLMQPSPTWLVPPSGTPEQARATLENLQPGFETTHYMPALRMAGKALAALPAASRTIVWMADEQRIGWIGAQFDETLPPGVKVRFAEVAPAPASQAAITSLRWSHDGLDPAVEVKIRLYSQAHEARQLTVKSGGKVVATRAVDLTAGAEQTVLIPLKGVPEAMRQGIAVSMDPDDFPADDTAWLAARPDSARTVLYTPGADDGARFLDHALGSLEQFDPEAQKAVAFPDGDWPAGAVAVATGNVFSPPLVDHLNKFVAAGGAVWIVVDGSDAQIQWLAAHNVRVTPRALSDEPEHLRDWDLDHPILEAFAGQSVMPLMEVEFQHGFSLAGDNLTSVANWPDGAAAIAEMASPGGRILISGFPLDRLATNWPVKPTFVPFVHQALHWLSSLQAGKTDFRIGDTIPLKGAQGTWHALDAARPQPDRQVSGSVRPSVPGLYEFFDGKTRQDFAVNTPLSESDLAPWPDAVQLTAFESKADPQKVDAVNEAAMRLSDEVAESRQRLWWWLLALAGVALLGELAVANRTSI